MALTEQQGKAACSRVMGPYQARCYNESPIKTYKVYDVVARYWMPDTETVDLVECEKSAAEMNQLVGEDDYLEDHDLPYEDDIRDCM